jgi:hypothetical protein
VRESLRWHKRYCLAEAEWLKEFETRHLAAPSLTRDEGSMRGLKPLLAQ